MNQLNNQIMTVPTNIITGFLGVGKTTAISHLLRTKPENETWAVLVNEFGEIGVDGSLLSGTNSEHQGVYIKEIAGGCMCCTASVTMQVGLTQLLRQAKPDRLLIEPTGLGHPKEVLNVLKSVHYRDVISLKSTITLVDARNLSDQRYTHHETYKQQIAIADIVVANKYDLYTAKDEQLFHSYIKKIARHDVKTLLTQDGVLAPSLLNHNSSSDEIESGHSHTHLPHHTSTASQVPIPGTGFIRKNNEGEGYQSVGWRFKSNNIFDYQRLVTLLTKLKVERMKGVFITDQGVRGFNLTLECLNEVVIQHTDESRVEIISEIIDDEFEQSIISCIV